MVLTKSCFQFQNVILINLMWNHANLTLIIFCVRSYSKFHYLLGYGGRKCNFSNGTSVFTMGSRSCMQCSIKGRRYSSPCMQYYNFCYCMFWCHSFFCMHEPLWNVLPLQQYNLHALYIAQQEYLREIHPRWYRFTIFSEQVQGDTIHWPSPCWLQKI